MTTRIDDGHGTLITFAEGTLSIWEKSTTPPGYEGGGATDTSTHYNETWRTRAPKVLKTLTDSTLTAAFDPAAYSELLAQVNVNQLITVTFPDGDTIAFWGWIDRFIPGEFVEGEQPTAEVTIIPSNQDASGAEIAPVYTAFV